MLETRQRLRALARLAHVPHAHRLVAAGGGDRALRAGLQMHGVDFLFVQLHRGGGELPGARVDDVVVAVVIDEVNRAPVRGDIAPAELVLVVRCEEFLEALLAALHIERANHTVVGRGDELTAETAPSPFQVAHVRAVRLVKQHAVFAAVAFFFRNARVFVVHAPQADVPVLVAGGDEKRAIGVVRRHVEVCHAARHDLRDGLISQRKLRLRQARRGGRRERKLCLLRFRLGERFERLAERFSGEEPDSALVEGSRALDRAGERITKELDERLVRALLAVHGLELDRPHGPRRTAVLDLTPAAGARPVGEHHAPVSALVVNPARERGIRRDVTHASRST